jgi:signal transduction histidine kinase
MEIRRLLFISFFVVLSLVALPLATLSFFSTRYALQEEIGHNLTSEAVMLMEELDMLMFERLQNVHSWSHLDIMQEARIGDVDKRLSKFLSDFELGYKGMYRNLFYVDLQQHIIAASTPELIGQEYAPAQDWLSAKIPNGDVIIENLQLTPPYTEDSLVICAPVDDSYSSNVIGQLYGLLDMNQLFRLLDKAVSSRSGDRYIVLLDAKGRTIAASSSLRNPQILLKNTFADWKPELGKTLFIHEGDPVTNSQVLVGYAQSAGYLGYEQMGWSILIFQNTDKAFLPIRVLWVLFSVVIILTLLLAILASHWISGRIAKPLTGLTQWVREVRQFEAQKPPKLGGAVEIRELEMAFDEMLQELERSRIHIIQAAKLAMVGEMAAIMAHEVRTPLGILSTSAQWLQRESSLSPEGIEMTHFILDESARLNRLVTTLLECARPREPQMSPYDIHDLILRTVELLRTQADKKQIHIENHLNAEHPIIDCDFELLTQVFLNLLLNAIQIVPDGGMIRVSSTNSLQNISIEITDNGPGIAVEDYQNLFDPFFTKREGGIGLGLTVTRQIVQAHHGKLSASPSDWGGACFTVLLPITQE